MRTIAIDAHSTTCELALLSKKGKLVMRREIRTNAKDLIDAVSSIPGKKELVIEETELASWLNRSLKPCVDKLVVSNPKQNKWIAKSELSNDKVDAFRLGRLYQGGYIKEIYHPEDGRQRFKELVLEYHDLDKQVVRYKNKIKSKYRQNGIFPKGAAVYSTENRKNWVEQLPDSCVVFQVNKWYKMLDLSVSLKEEVRKRVIKEGKKYPEIAKFQQIPGIGPIIASTVSAIIDTPFRFSRKNKVWSYARMGLRKKKSGRGYKPGGRERLSKDGNRILKKVTMTAVEGTLRSRDNPFRRKFHDLVINKHIDSSLAKLTIGRCILSTMIGMWKTGEDYSEEKLNISTGERYDQAVICRMKN